MQCYLAAGKWQNAAGGPARPHDGPRQHAKFQNASKTDAQGASATIGLASGRTTTLRTDWLRRRNQPREILGSNDILDRPGIMALPLPLSDQQRKQIYDALMADNWPLSPAQIALKPASGLLTKSGAAMACIHCPRASAVSMVLRGFITEVQGRSSVGRASNTSP